MPDIDDYTVTSDTAKQFRRLSLGTVRTVSGTTDTLLAADNGCIVQYTSSSAITVTIPPDLGANFSCTLVQWGGGQITVSPGSGVTRNSEDGQYKTSGQYAGVYLYALSANTFWMSGSTAA